jgi:hypothetical protein
VTKAVLCSKIKYNEHGLRAGRGLQIILVLTLIWLSVVLFSGTSGDPTHRLAGDRTGLVGQVTVAPAAIPRGESATPFPQAKPAQPGSEPNDLGEALSGTAKKGGGSSFRAPGQIANLIKCKNLEEVVEKYSRQYGVDEDLVWAVIRQESGFNAGAVSPKGAMGLMQLMPGTAALLGVSDPFDVEQNVAGGVKYLEQCLNQFNQDVPLALAAYNAGPGNVVKYQGCPPFAETRNYVSSILAAYAGEAIREDWKLSRVNYVVGEELAAAAAPLKGLPWRIPLPNWKIGTPQCKLGSPHWKVTVRPF